MGRKKQVQQSACDDDFSIRIDWRYDRPITKKLIQIDLKDIRSILSLPLTLTYPPGLLVSVSSSSTADEVVVLITTLPLSFSAKFNKELFDSITEGW
mmetsp:Transcript_8879/g.9813  ORF Transcript_8879/g.9813 Transcript_8879/m.9813 type:complete len:97 (+) Transcript_8879:291-581(+)